MWRSGARRKNGGWRRDAGGVGGGAAKMAAKISGEMVSMAAMKIMAIWRKKISRRSGVTISVSGWREKAAG